MSLLMNILWLVLGGVVTAVEYIVGSVAMMITIIGIPFGIQTLKIGLLCLCPFGKRVEASPQSGGCLSLIMNIFGLLQVAFGSVSPTSGLAYSSALPSSAFRSPNNISSWRDLPLLLSASRL